MLFPTITIPKPCNKGWQNMTIAEKGRFCGSCQKVVVDFTNSTHEEIINHYHKNNGKACGYFNVSRLIQQNKEIKIKKYYFYHLCIFYLSALFAFGSNLFTVSITQAKNIFESIKKKYNYVNPTVDTFIIKGKVTDKETKEAVINAKISLIKNGKTIKTIEVDISGNFQLSIPKDAESEKFSLNISCFGYQNLQVAVDIKNAKTLLLKLDKIPEPALPGGVGLAN